MKRGAHSVAFRHPAIPCVLLGNGYSQDMGYPAYLTSLLLRPAIHRVQRCFLASGCSPRRQQRRVTEASSGIDRAERVHVTIGVVLLVFAAFATLPGVYLPLGPVGIDPGWQWAVNQAHDAGLVFGRDIVFTYGPLAFLIVPLDVSSNLVVANLFLLVVQALFAAGLVLLFLHTRILMPTVVFTLLFFCARHQGLALEAQILLAVGVLALLAVLTGRWWPLAAAAGLTGVLMMVKISLGVAALTILGAALAVAVFLFRRPASFAVGLLPFPVVFLALALLLFDGPGSFFNWLYLSAEVVSGYSVANSILGPGLQVAVGAISVIAWLAAAVAFRRNRSLLACNLIFAAVVVIEFRLAFVRQDTHQLQFIPFMLALVAVSALLAQRPRWLIAHIAVFGFLLVGGTATGLVDPLAHGLFSPSLLTGGSGPRAISSLVHLEDTRRRLAVESESNLSLLRLPTDWLELVRGSQNGVGTLPWEIQYCPANALPWNPTPTLQLYSAYTAALDRWSARHYAGGKAPDFIVDEYVPVGKRHQMIDAPATWREVFIRYRLREALLDPTQVALLERREVTPNTAYVLVGDDTIVLGGAGVVVPTSEHLLFAEIDLRLDWFGRLQKTLFRVPLIYLVMRHASGHSTYYRLTPGPASNGVLINRFPRDFMGYRRLWQGIVDDPVVRCAITGPGTPFFHPEATVAWRELRFQAPVR